MLWLNPNLEIGLSLLFIIGLLSLSSLLSAAEVAYFSLTHEDIITLKERNTRATRRVLRLIDKPRYLLATLLLANTLISIGIVLILGLLYSSFFEDNTFLVFALQGGTAAILIMFFGELLPKIYGGQHALAVAIFAAVPIRLIHVLTLPANLLLVFGSNILQMRSQQMQRNMYENDTNSSNNNTEPEQRNGSSNPLDVAAYAKQNVQILKSFVNFSSTTVRVAMCMRADVVAVNINAPFKEIMQVFKETSYSRLPVYEDNIDHIKGVVYIKDMLAHIDDHNDEWHWHSSCRAVLYVPENKKLDQLLSEFQQKRIHFAVVVDEFGHTGGIITLEDILEELVGDIEDESDEPEEIAYQQPDENTYIFNATFSLLDLCELLHLDKYFFKEWEQDVDTLAGLVIIQHGALPPVGTIVQVENLVFTVLAANERKIEKIQLKIQ
jgi:gliding motility-associated protein GldE